MNASIENQLQRLRVIVESDIGATGNVLVTAATPFDEPDLLALGLAFQLAASGKRTALIRLREDLEAYPRPRIAIGRRLDIVSYASRGAAGHETPASLAARLLETRSRYDYCVIEGGVLDENALSLEAAHVADGVVVAVALGRSSEPADAELVPSLSRVNARFVGAVALDPDALRAHGEAIKSARASWQHVYDGAAPNSEEPAETPHGTFEPMAKT